MSVERANDGATDPDDVLAYVFWHQPAQGQAATDYEAALVSFHRRLAATPVAGLLASRSGRAGHLPWLTEGGYEDWYLLRDFAALGALNTAAVDPDRRNTHDDIARRSAHGAGALYGLSAGTASAEPSWVTWLSKPRSLPYEEFYRGLFEHVGSARSRSLPAGTGVWRRQLVLGPAPEFCLTAPEPLPVLPSGWHPVSAPVHTVHAGGDPLG